MRFLLMLPLALVVGCAGSDPVETVSSALTVDQCTYFAAAGNGTVTICHATSSAKNPYVIIRTDEQGCINGHEDHAGDKISLDGTCADGCFPPGAPVDEDEKCCDGQAVGGFCPQCIPGECQKSGGFDMKNAGECVFFPLDPGTPCSDEDACTREDRCNEKGECFGFPVEGCTSCSADAQAAGDAAYWACKNGRVATDCELAGFEAFEKAYEASGCKEQPAKWKAP